MKDSGGRVWPRWVLFLEDETLYRFPIGYPTFRLGNLNQQLEWQKPILDKLRGRSKPNESNYGCNRTLEEEEAERVVSGMEEEVEQLTPHIVLIDAKINRLPQLFIAT